MNGLKSTKLVKVFSLEILLIYSSSKAMQSDEIDILGALTSLLKAISKI